MTARRQPNPNTESVDNYLKAILTLGGPEESRVTGNALAHYLDVAPASITNMLQKLAASSPPLVEYERHRGVQLAASGKKRALEVVRHHRLIETFLYEVLDYPIDKVHEEAERLEHFISELFEERIAAKLGHPKIDPHGHCIPTMDGKMPKQNSISLTDALEGTFIVESVSDHDARTLKLLKSSGIGPGVHLRLKSQKADDFAVSIGRSAKTLHLTREAAAAIRIHPHH
ncbi:MAG TPA: metal-dependent transcriptional regulator [Acidobacteriaceae bacterium]|jgi:DtxR family Mn-dependent transcriptional regulator|nr:metal-dependent transcriptional regulator [Acidobacteriaceae bacterium]